MESYEIAGARTEARFFKVCSERAGYTPGWFCKIKRADIAWDLRGVDAFAYIRCPHRAKRVKVPIQIKSSDAGRNDFLRTRPVHDIENILVFVVRDRDDDGHVRRTFYNELWKLREKGIDFDDFLRIAMQKKIPSHVWLCLHDKALQIRNYSLREA
ncbi:MAG TPA: hypothetical protein VFL98_00145 [Candidatus Paceibacterota bacterium]|nr:hypothetical protein [Candidatus Paceibacterota bacterium]